MGGIGSGRHGGAASPDWTARRMISNISGHLSRIEYGVSTHEGEAA